MSDQIREVVDLASSQRWIASSRVMRLADIYLEHGILALAAELDSEQVVAFARAMRALSGLTETHERVAEIEVMATAPYRGGRVGQLLAPANAALYDRLLQESGIVVLEGHTGIKLVLATVAVRNLLLDVLGGRIVYAGKAPNDPLLWEGKAELDEIFDVLSVRQR